MDVPSNGDETILMVEDDELVRMSVQSLIESLGYRVVPARDGPDALEILRRDTPIDLGPTRFTLRPRRGDCDQN